MKYIIFKGTEKMNGKELKVGEQLRIDLTNCKIEEVTELNGLKFKEVTEGHTNGDYTRMYIEIIGEVKKTSPVIKSAKGLEKIVKEDIIKNFGSLNCCKDCTISELCSEEVINMVSDFSEKYEVSHSEYKWLVLSTYATHSYVGSMEELKREILMDVIDINIVGKKKTSFTKYKAELLRDCKC